VSDTTGQATTPLCDAAACRCPLCGQPNACIAATTGSFESACWCTQVQFSASVLARVPVDARGRACICQACAKADQAG